MLSKIFFQKVYFLTALLLISKATQLSIPFVDEEEDPRFGKPKTVSATQKTDFGISGFHLLDREVKQLISLYMNWEDEQYRVKMVDLMFAKFMRKHRVKYSSGNESAYRRKVFEENMWTAAHVNHHFARGKLKFRLGTTKFSDLTDAEFLAKYTTNISAPQRPLSESLGEAEESFKLSIPSEMDYRDEKIVGPVEDQGECGACYSFASVAAVEAAYSKKYGTGRQYRVLSKQEMVDCGTNFSKTLKGCDGGVLDTAFMFLKQNGVSEDEVYPYSKSKGECRKVTPFTKIRGHNVLRSVDQNHFMDMLSDTPVALAMETLPYMKLYQGGIVDIKGPCGFFYNHAILAIAYDLNDDFPYITLKNTYGEGWGDEGYMQYQLGFGNLGMCGVVSDNVSYPLL